MWSKVHQDQLWVLRCADALTGTAGDETKINSDDFDRGSADPDQLRTAQQPGFHWSLHAKESRSIL